MPKYTVKNKESGRTITFNWNGKQPPTDKDMEQVFSAAQEFKPTEIENVPSGSGGFIESMSPDIPEKSPYSLKNTEGVVRPLMEFGGMTAGGVVGTGSPVPGGGIVGAGLGYAAGKKGADILYGKPQGTVGEELLTSAVDVSQGAAMEMGGAVIGKLVAEYGVPAAKQVRTVVKKGMEKAIRPGVAKQRTAAQAKEYYERATDAVTNIVLNKNNLKLTDESGKVVEGLPKSLKQFSDAIDQTKRIIFKEYDDLAKAASAQKTKTYQFKNAVGVQPKAHIQSTARIDLKPIEKELQTVLSSNPFRDMAPSSAKYAESRLKVLANRGSYSPLEAQEAIQILNKTLESFYKNPSFEMATNAGIDAMIANNLRKGLDKTISELTGKQYQQLKNAYGALKEIEKDVGHRVAIDARKNIKGLIDFSDIFSGGEFVAGVVSMNPAFIARGAVAKSIASFYKYVNNPNRIVKSMFSNVELMLRRQQIANRSTSSAVGRQLGRTAGYGINYGINNEQGE